MELRNFYLFQYRAYSCEIENKWLDLGQVEVKVTYKFFSPWGSPVLVRAERSS